MADKQAAQSTAQRVPLTDDEVRVLEMFGRQFQAAQMQAAMAANFEAEYLSHLRGKYGLDNTWVCQDTAQGFVKLEKVTQDD